MMEEKLGREISPKEASESARNLVGYFDLLYKIDQRIKRNGKG